ncbi:MAG: hypothetical protein ABL919_16555 [Methylococcales bacterium]
MCTAYPARPARPARPGNEHYQHLVNNRPGTQHETCRLPVGVVIWGKGGVINQDQPQLQYWSLALTATPAPAQNSRAGQQTGRD